MEFITDVYPPIQATFHFAERNPVNVLLEERCPEKDAFTP